MLEAMSSLGGRIDTAVTKPSNDRHGAKEELRALRSAVDTLVSRVDHN
jgi:hypothetical protein